MDNKRLDEAVEVAIRKWYADDPSHMVEAWQVEYMRAALLAGMKMLLGDPVAWIAGSEHFYNEVAAHRHLAVWGKTGKPQPLYAPSLGEGDGR